jgi:hypothetical protein
VVNTTQAEMRFRVRPFERAYQVPPHTVIALAGAIRDRCFVLSVDFEEYRIPIADLHRDEFGPYVEISEQQIPNADCSVLAVEPEVEEVPVTVLAWMTAKLLSSAPTTTLPFLPPSKKPIGGT